jgi:hypothetical protein
MGNEKRPEVTGKNKVPGPGSYPSKSTVGEGPKIGLSPRINPLKPTAIVPGPGAYEPKHNAVVDKTPSPGIGYGDRNSLQTKTTTNVPGPGAYVSTDMKASAPKFGFGTSQRVTQKANPNPGPGNYSLPPTLPELPSYEKSKSKVL